jgi:peptidoglycan/LPS O-acetylase OafA/YrhL
MLVVGSWIALLAGLGWVVQRLSPHWAITVVASGIILVVGTSALLYWLFETNVGTRAHTWFMRVTGPVPKDIQLLRAEMPSRRSRNGDVEPEPPDDPEHD